MSKGKQVVDDRFLFKSSKGVEIRLQSVDPLFLQTVSRSVKIPEVPTYETKTMSGRIEVHPFDAKAAEQTPGGVEIWQKYQSELADAIAEQNDRVLRAAFLDGTVRPKEWHDERWFKRMRIVGIDLPDDEDELWVMYLLTTLSQEDIATLTTKIIRLTGVPEEMIEAAEEIFRSGIRDSEQSEANLAEESA